MIKLHGKKDTLKYVEGLVVRLKQDIDSDKNKNRKFFEFTQRD